MSALLPLLVLGQTIVSGSGQSSAGDLNGYYNSRREVTFSGVVTGKTKGQAPGYSQGMSILVKSGRTIREVELGPTWYVGRQDAAVNLGDKIKVTGVPLVIDRRETVILARQIVRGKSILALRDSSGYPYWTVRRSTRVASNGSYGAAQRMGTSYQGQIGNMQTFMVNGEEYAGYVLNTANGPVNVAVAPTWYWNNQPTVFNPGDPITVYGTGRVTNLTAGQTLGNSGVFLLDSASYNGGTIVLRPGGLPIYGGFRRYP